MFWKILFFQLIQLNQGQVQLLETSNFETLHSQIEKEIMEQTDDQVKHDLENVENGITNFQEKYFEVVGLLKKREEEILELKKELQNFKAVSNLTQTHKGEWKCDKLVQDFFLLDNEVKENLRKEKNRRITLMMKELEWIVDTDDPIQGKGEWSCCKNQTYQSECTKL